MELPNDREKAREAPSSPILEPSGQISGHDTGEVTAPRSEALDIRSIRRAAERGEPQTVAVVLALVERLERAEHNLSYAMSALQRADSERLAFLDVVAAARAWVDAVGRCDGVVAAEQALMAAIARCE